MLFWICLSKTCSQFLHQCWYKHDVWNPSYFNSTNPYEIQIFSGITEKIPFLEMVIQFFWRFPKPQRNDIFVGNRFVSPNDIDLTDVDPIVATLDKVENEITGALANILGNSTLLVKEEGLIKELSLLDTILLEVTSLLKRLRLGRRELSSSTFTSRSTIKRALHQMSLVTLRLFLKLTPPTIATTPTPSQCQQRQHHQQCQH